MRSLAIVDKTFVFPQTESQSSQLHLFCINAADDSILSIWRESPTANKFILFRNNDLLGNFDSPQGHIASLKYLAESDSLCLCFSSGDIILVPLANSNEVLTFGCRAIAKRHSFTMYRQTSWALLIMVSKPPNGALMKNC